MRKIALGTVAVLALSGGTVAQAQVKTQLKPGDQLERTCEGAAVWSLRANGRALRYPANVSNAEHGTIATYRRRGGYEVKVHSSYAQRAGGGLTVHTTFVNTGSRPVHVRYRCRG